MPLQIFYPQNSKCKVINGTIKLQIIKISTRKRLIKSTSREFSYFCKVLTENIYIMHFRAYPDLQFSSVREIKSFQNLALRDNLNYIASESPYYKRLFVQEGIDVLKIRSIEDLKYLPTTNKSVLQQHNKDFFAVPQEDIIDYTTTSGTLGRPVVVPLSENDLTRLAYNERNSFTTAGLCRQDILQLMLTLDKRFMAGMAYFLGARDMGMGVVRVGSGVPGLQWDTVRQIRPTACMAVPSFLLKLAEYAEAEGIDFRHSTLRTAVCIGEGMRNPDLSLNTIGQRLVSVWPELSLRSTYASTEMQTSFTECGSQCGGHLPPDLIICEFLDENDNPVGDGEPGELCITTLGVEAFPLLRFKTGDICLHYSEPCGCGRNTLRVSPLLGRKQQMIKYKGTTFYPSALYDLLDGIDEIKNYVVEVFTNSIGTDDILIMAYAPVPSDHVIDKVRDVCRRTLRAVPTFKFESEEKINAIKFPKNSRKAIKLVDKRQE